MTLDEYEAMHRTLLQKRFDTLTMLTNVGLTWGLQVVETNWHDEVKGIIGWVWTTDSGRAAMDLAGVVTDNGIDTDDEEFMEDFFNGEGIFSDAAEMGRDIADSYFEYDGYVYITRSPTGIAAVQGRAPSLADLVAEIQERGGGNASDVIDEEGNNATASFMLNDDHAVVPSDDDSYCTVCRFAIGWVQPTTLAPDEYGHSTQATSADVRARPWEAS